MTVARSCPSTPFQMSVFGGETGNRKRIRCPAWSHGRIDRGQAIGASVGLPLLPNG
jgi:hypothetical protein